MSEMLSLDFDKYKTFISHAHLTREIGKVSELVGYVLRGYLPGASIGSVCEIFPSNGQRSFFAEVVGFRDRQVILMPLGEMRGVGLGAKILLCRQTATIKVGESLLGRVLNGLGEPIDNKGDIESEDEVSIYSSVRNPLERKPIREPIDLGVRSINGLLTVGRGQRVGIMAGSGVGKSVLLGMIARSTDADVNVIALIGERGREVREFIENDLGEEGLKKSIVIVATSDESPLVRMRGAFLATAIAEYFSGRGSNVLLMMDSVTRFAMAQREIGLSTGEPPASKGYTPSVFALLPKLLERAGSFENSGSITGLYSVLVEGDDIDDPIGDAVRSIVDGHIVLSREMAQKGHFPAIDVLQSNSRVMKNIADETHIEISHLFREHLSILREAEDLINIGAYKSGANPKIDRAIELQEEMIGYLKQKVNDKTDFENSIRELNHIFEGEL